MTPSGYMMLVKAHKLIPHDKVSVQEVVFMYLMVYLWVNLGVQSVYNNQGCFAIHEKLDQNFAMVYPMCFVPFWAGEGGGCPNPNHCKQ